MVSHRVIVYNREVLDPKDPNRASLLCDKAIRVNLFHNIALLVLLENRITKHRLRVANTHLPSDPAYADTKLLHAAILMQHLRIWRSDSHATSTIVTGDFNSLPGSGVVRFLGTGRLLHSRRLHFGDYDFGRYTSTPHLRHSLCLADAYEHASLPATHRTPQFGGVLDYIFFDRRGLLQCSLLDDVEMASGERYELLSKRFPSDHLPLVATFQERAYA
ncbi:uncharacterized protein VTP21DRAFT_1966 [Calcarisporiella thermophila]|uniref:uncharacterized protein n=1 Tax=Calcarisporiella thermophila TaxID=911321 RepID=UPI0037428999